MLFISLIFSLAVVAAQHQDGSEDTLGESTATALFQPEVTALPDDLHRRAKEPQLTTSTGYVMGDEIYLSTYGSLCGFVTTDIHWPVACSVGEYCFHDGPNVECCSTTSTSPFVSTSLYTITSTDRNLATITSVSTTLDTGWYSVYGSNCTVAGPQTCYNYNQTASCTGSCTNTALLCTDPYFPACASLYSVFENGTSIGSSFVYSTTSFAFTYYCDTDAYGLQYMNFGYSPSYETTYTFTVSATTSSTEIFTPTPTPFSRTQPSRPATKAQQARLSPATGSSSSTA
ncbi:hypothetical protein H2200_002827 [Cladophialophora chaetospira]|uniref:Uncharacterized protein n=1 Tax=Cladophialophora chaetospira TaxID=386627 RepID=A0AA38XGX1_9EURO|nr:hypothetical protein H2200_002827 [Cladophialophora chaetospira]